MSSEFKGLSCARCKSYLFEEDDVVFCPVCGAPHHRACYNALGHCALEELHGTENEYSRKKAEPEEESENSSSADTVKCQMCGEEYDASFNRCNKCGAPNISRITGFPQFDFLGGVPNGLDLGDGVTADEAKQFVLSNTHRYIPKFAKLNKSRKKSWNWLAFITPSGWLLSRKMYKSGIIAIVLTVISTILSYPFYSAINVSETTVIATTVDMLKMFNEAGPVAIFMLILSLALDAAIRLIPAFFGDYWYKNYVISSIKKIEKSGEEKNEAFRKKGGVSFILLMLGIFIPNFIVRIILLFLM